MPRGYSKGGGKRVMRTVRLPGAPLKKRGFHQDQEEGRVDATTAWAMRPFPSRTWGPILPSYDGPSYSAVKVYDGEGRLLRTLSRKVLGARTLKKGPRVDLSPAPYDWRLPGQPQKQRRNGWGRKYGFPVSGGTPILPQNQKTG